jgi:DNA replication protein DnaC
MSSKQQPDTRLATTLPKEAILIEGQGVVQVAMPAEPFTGEVVEESICACGEPFTARILLINGLVSPIKVQRCQTCIDEYDAAKREEERKALRDIRANRFADICPPLYRETDIERAIKEKGLDRKKVCEILTWRPERDGIGLGIIGHSRMIKTRLMYALLKYLVIEEGWNVAAINAAKFADTLAGKYGEGSGSAERWLSTLCKVPLLFVDDVGKEKMTERAEVAFYRIVEERTSHLLPILFTSNLTSKELKARMTDEGGVMSDRAEPITERLKEFCKVISFIRQD